MMNSESTTGDGVRAGGLVERLVPFVHVVDVEASVGFYQLLGFVVVNVQREGGNGAVYWAMLRSGKAEIMLARASGRVDAGQQAVLLYMYSADVAGLRRQLLASGVRDGGVYSGKMQFSDRNSTAYEIARPAYMPCGEMRVIDPDGYVILVGEVG